MTANPRSRNDPFSKRFLVPFEHELNKSGIYEDDLHLIIRVNWDDNPFFPEVLHQEMEYDRENTSTAMFRHVWGGDYYDSVDDALISVEHFEAAIDAHIKLGFKPEGPIIASHDPSDLGPDAKGYCLRQGSVILDVKEMITGDTNEGVDWAIDLARQSKADWFVWDGDGIGLGLRRQVMQSLDGSRINYEMFRGSEGAEDPMLYYGGDKGRTNRTRSSIVGPNTIGSLGIDLRLPGEQSLRASILTRRSSSASHQTSSTWTSSGLRLPGSHRSAATTASYRFSRRWT